jgi:hypothetical protein
MPLGCLRLRSAVPVDPAGLNRGMTWISHRPSAQFYRLASLVARWPVSERASYQAAFDSLVSRGFFIQRAGEQMFSITGAGLKAMV